ncbi:MULTISPECIES: beta/gamma crystallin domain-containing protein [Saccharopolyspora]|uniref:Beta/gamma crystallin domain-containing protein n=1 Tax=Saccharopolyspora cebuensis TaxID=418759 RepID=A0ABV4CNY8_9PSEU
MARLNRKIASVLGTALVTAGLFTIAPAGVASTESTTPRINTVPCNSNDFLRVTWHRGNRAHTTCFANAGEYSFPADSWLDNFSTGNNRVQYKADGRWQPNNPVGKYTYFHFPNHPGGVNLQAIRIR